MADLIDRDQTKLSFCDSCSHKGDCFPTMCGIHAVLDEQPAVNRWISVEDALPDNNRDVLVQYNPEYNSSDKRYAVAFFGKRTEKWIELISGKCLDVIRWRELIQE